MSIERIGVEVANRWDAVALLEAFADRGSFLVQRTDHFEVFVHCEAHELRERAAGLRPTSTMSAITFRQASGSLPEHVALTVCESPPDHARHAQTPFSR